MIRRENQCSMCSEMAVCMPHAGWFVCVQCLRVCVEIVYDKLAGAMLAEQERVRAGDE